jgi:hypothetical protein
MRFYTKKKYKNAPNINYYLYFWLYYFILSNWAKLIYISKSAAFNL